MSEDACAHTPFELDGAARDRPSPRAARDAGASLVLISTPIGNLGDIGRRAMEMLAAADLVLCEDTRTTARLLSGLGLHARTEPLHEHNEEARIPGILARLAAGATVALVSDAGTPLVSDPGFRLVRAAIAAGIEVTAIPGPNAALTALTISGLPPHPFLFLGFPPPRTAARIEAFRQLRAAEAAGLRATSIWHEAPHRLVEMLDDLALVFETRDAAVARELTKRFEEVRRGSPAALAASFRERPPRGEITVLLGPSSDAAEATGSNSLDEQLRQALLTMSVKDAASLVAGSCTVPRRVVYARALELARASAGAQEGQGAALDPPRD